ncbi:VPLPA-CTERM sorting domain-containing protein [Yoonia sp. R2331]|uniref:VPLPA-CTERM sorting domain-containing protein n=1 Tax=Yoonia sp. R2331 TaxID=3237238 RepID=UPI0034E3E6BA
MYLKNILAMLTVACAGQMASAATVSVFSGSATELSGVTDAADDALKADGIQYFTEVENFVLPVTQVVNYVVGVPIPKGTEVNVYMVFLNSLSSGFNRATAGLEFEGDILGLIYHSGGLNKFNPRYGGAGYGQLSGIETGRGDTVGVAGNRLVVDLNNRGGTGDWVRVLTSSTPSTGQDNPQPGGFGDNVASIPLPASGFLFGFGVAGFAAMRRIKRKR